MRELAVRDGDMTDQQAKVVLITGAGKGAGRRAAHAFATQGGRLALNDIAPNNVETLLEELNQQGYDARVFIEEVAKKLSAQVLINRVVEEWGHIDVLVNHAMVEPHAEMLRMDE